MIKENSEAAFEKEVIEYLTKVGGTKQWEYLPEIKTTEQLWDNFKKIVEQNNRGRIQKDELSDTEFHQVKQEIEKLATPYEAGRFLYGMNGVSQIEISMDEGGNVPLTIFDQNQVGTGNTVYQVVNQIERPAVLSDKKTRRFDVTLLMNGLPIIQIELKASSHSPREALNQMHQYIAERQYTGIFATVQILIAMTPFETRYMANATQKDFNTAFAFKWQEEATSKQMNGWKEFTNHVLSIPMAHELATRYMILDGTLGREKIIVMRPYQVYATRSVIRALGEYRYRFGKGKIGYVWHTTGSGKTITSFKTAWLASRLPNVDKVVFLVDRVALTKQTYEAYQAYDPFSKQGIGKNSGIVGNTAHKKDLLQKLTKRDDKNIIVTSIQKMASLVNSDMFKPIDKNVVFIVDEAHRSTGDGKSKGMLEDIRKAMPTAAWVGYTGTPKFPETREIFGDMLHGYTIKEAIADKNVLGFNVEFRETIPAPENPTEEEMDDMIKASVYDTKEEHVQLVVEDIFNHWRERSNNRKYNALLTVHVGGVRPSTPRAMQYYDEFQRVNATKPEAERLAVGIIFSELTDNSDGQLDTNLNLSRAIQEYNQQFHTAFDMTKMDEYKDDLCRRLNKTANDGQYLDLVIVVDQLLTGFDAPGLNTLYIDRTLKGANLIQAYSRTNRIHHPVDKPWGNVVNYRWPKQNEFEMQKAFYLYANRKSASEQQTLDTEIDVQELEDEYIISKPFHKVLAHMHEVVGNIHRLTEGYTQVPVSETQQKELYHELKEYNRVMTQLKQYTEDDQGHPISAYDNPTEFYELVGIREEEEEYLTGKVARDLRKEFSQKQNVDVSQIDLEMVHIHDVRINYDYLMGLIADMANEIHEEKIGKAKRTKEKIVIELEKEENADKKAEYTEFVERIFDGTFVFNSYPISGDVETMEAALQASKNQQEDKAIADFIHKFGLHNAVTPDKMKQLILKHGEDIEKEDKIDEWILAARGDYKNIAEEEIASLSWIQYRLRTRAAFGELVRKFI